MIQINRHVRVRSSLRLTFDADRDLQSLITPQAWRARTVRSALRLLCIPACQKAGEE